MIKRHDEIILREISTAIRATSGCVAPLFHVSKNSTPQLLGSSVLIDISGNLLLCTAKHVLETAQFPLYINGPSSLEILLGEFYRSQHHDIAVLLLTLEQIRSFQKYTPLPESRIANQTQTEACHYVEFIGYPETKNRVSPNKYKLPNRLYSFGCAELRISQAEVRFKFTKMNRDTETNLRVQAPNLPGVSGGPIMGVSLSSDSTIKGNPDPKLIGIFTDHIKESNEVFGPTAAILIAAIKEGWSIKLPSLLDR